MIIGLKPCVMPLSRPISSRPSLNRCERPGSMKILSQIRIGLLFGWHLRMICGVNNLFQLAISCHGNEPSLSSSGPAAGLVSKHLDRVSRKSKRCSWYWTNLHYNRSVCQGQGRWRVTPISLAKAIRYTISISSDYYPFLHIDNPFWVGGGSIFEGSKIKFLIDYRMPETMLTTWAYTCMAQAGTGTWTWHQEAHL